MKMAGRFLGLFEHLNLNGGVRTLQVELVANQKNLPAAAPVAHD